MKKHGYTKSENEKKVKEAYEAGVTTAYKISKLTGLHYKTVADILFRLGLADQSRVHSAHIGYYVFTSARGEQTFYIFGSVYQAVAYFKRRIDPFYSQSHATKLFKKAIEQYDGSGIYIYNNVNTGVKILYYAPATEEDLKDADENNEVEFLP